MNNKEEVRKQLLTRAGYFTVETLIQKLQQLKEEGHGSDLVAGMNGYLQFCDFDKNDKCIVIL